MTLVVNLFGAPGAGKSTTAAGVFHQLKTLGKSCEYVSEVAKNLTWEERHNTLQCQAYIFGKQYRDLWRVAGKVDIIVTDSPLLLSCIYKPDHYPDSFEKFVNDMYGEFDNMNFFIRRTKKYVEVGRNQTEAESNVIGDKVLDYLKTNGIYHQAVDGNADAVHMIVEQIKDRLP